MCSAPDALPAWAAALLHDARVGHLATASARGAAHVVPVCFALLGGALYIAIDEKPKSGRRLQRLRNIESTGNAALVVDHYDEDWTRLAWVLARGPASVISPDDPAHDPAIAVLRAKYPQYRAMRLEDAELIELRPAGWSCWRASEASEYNERER
jgi:PPOX class probable F420-dependent enzyme